MNLKTKRQFSGKYRKIFREVVEIISLKRKHPQKRIPQHPADNAQNQSNLHHLTGFNHSGGSRDGIRWSGDRQGHGERAAYRHVKDERGGASKSCKLSLDGGGDDSKHRHQQARC